jgi:hypothetical protein
MTTAEVLDWIGRRCTRLADLTALRTERRVLVDIAAHAVEPLRVAFTGDVSTGKSTLVNAVLDAKVAEVQREECTDTVTWYRSPVVAAPPALGPSHRWVPLRFDLGDHAVVVDTPGVNTPSANAHATTALFDPAMPAVAAVSVLFYLVDTVISKAALHRVHRFAKLASSQLDEGYGLEGCSVVLVGSKADHFATGAHEAGSVAAREVMVADLQAALGESATSAVAVMPALGAAVATGVLTDDTLALIQEIARRPELAVAADDGWPALREVVANTAPHLDDALRPLPDRLGTPLGLCRAAELVRTQQPPDVGSAVRDLWWELSGVGPLKALLRDLAAARDVLTLPIVCARLRLSAIRSGAERGGPIGELLDALVDHPGLVDHARRSAALVLDGPLLRHLPEPQRRVAAALLRGDVDHLDDTDLAFWRRRASQQTRSVKDQRIARLVADAAEQGSEPDPTEAYET